MAYFYLKNGPNLIMYLELDSVLYDTKMSTLVTDTRKPEFCKCRGEIG